jgi:putative glycosyltransferase (TIGR04348 family)
MTQVSHPKRVQKKLLSTEVLSPSSVKRKVVIVSPALASANNGNWQTAKRYRQLLAPYFRVRVVSEWDGNQSDDVLIALHARRSHGSIAAWHASRGSHGLVVVLTGTDLYRDIQHDPQAQQSLEFASRLIVLQQMGLDELPPALHGKTTVVFQSTTSRVTLPKTARCTRAVMVGHLREEKSPRTLFEAAALLVQQRSIYIQHIGAEHDPRLANVAHQTAAHCPQYQFSGALSYAQTRRQIQRAHVLVHTSVMEGGAHVLMEAICSGVPVIASHIPGNMGMLGENYAGFFPVGDAQALADRLIRFQHDPEFQLLLKTQCAQRAPLFSAEHERNGLLTIIENVIPAQNLS